MSDLQKVYDLKKEVIVKAIEKTKEDLVNEDVSAEALRGLLSLLSRCQERFLKASDDLLAEKLTNGDDADTLLKLELEQGEIYSTSEGLAQKIDDIWRSSKKDVDGASVKSSKELHHRLPKLELPKFSGDVRDWLQFWSQFETVHKDENMDTIVKFQYLVQCMKSGSQALEIVSSYPMSEKNYPLAVQSLKERYGHEDILVEVYVRDLIGLMVHHRSTDISSLYVKLSSQLRALGTLGVTSDKSAAILYPMVESTLPEDVLLVWERFRMSTVFKDENKSTSEIHLEQLMKFLQDEVSGKERVRLARQGVSDNSKSRSNDKGRSTPATVATFVSTEKSGDSCIFCEMDHPSQDCCRASNLSHEEKIALVKKHKRCFCCLKPGHTSKKCRSPVKCLCCGKRHWTIMCRTLKSPAPISDSSAKEQLGNSNQNKSVEMCNHVVQSRRVLQTVLIKLFGKDRMRIVRAILDSCSVKSYILKKTVEQLGLESYGHEEVIHILFGGLETKPQKHQCYKVMTSSLDASYDIVLEVSDKDKITGTVDRVPLGPWTEELKKYGIQLSDGHGTECEEEIEVLIGADFYGKLLTGKKVDLESGPTAIETKFGWTMLGKLEESYCEKREPGFAIAHHVLDLAVTDLWSLDIIGISEPSVRVTREQQQMAAMSQFLDSVKVNEDGRYLVRLPWYPDHPPLPTNRGIAEKRLLSTTKELQKQGLVEGYHQVFMEWEADGIIEEVPASEQGNYGHYLGHRAVLKPGSTTSIRPVFNASAKTKNTPSLNDCLEVGPNLLEEIPNIHIRFRMNEVGVISDIRKAFLQMGVVVEDRDFLRFLWWTDATCMYKRMFRHRRVVFGVSSSPFLLGAALLHLLNEAIKKRKFKDSAVLLKKSFYVDNCVTSLSSMEAASKFKEEATQLLAKRKFDLRGWEFGPVIEEKIVPVLGLNWNVKQDSLSFVLPKNRKWEGHVTKRKILSLAQGIFDPLGIVCAFTIIPKMLMQESWKLKFGWDNEVSADISKKFLWWTMQLDILSEITIPRHFCDQDRATWSLHVFSDASKDSYASCVFLRSGAGTSVKVQLVMAKARVAPLKNMTIPRLELLACGIGTRLCDTVKRSMELEDIPTFYWSDSSTALAWIRRQDNWSRFVDNRVNEIRKLSGNSQWRHVPGKMNPADLPSRGTSLSQLVEIRWWEGPRWLCGEEDTWPASEYNPDEGEISEEMKKTVLCSVNVETTAIFEKLFKFSDYHKIVRVIAYCLRYKNNFIASSRRKALVNGKCFVKISGELNLEEMNKAEVELLRYIQQTEFPEGVKDSRFRDMAPIVDSDGLIRIKTKVVDHGEEFARPIVLPSKNRIVWRMIWKCHVLNSHAVGGILLAHLREKFWILNGRRECANVTKHCVKCLRFRVKSCEAPEPPLPKDRVRLGPAFDVTGVDFAGPLSVKGKGKHYIALFTCASYRAVHLELVNSLTTEGFIMALRRFVARRGRPSTIYSDNGLNFVGTHNLFAAVDWKEVQQHANVNRIMWKFNPPTAAWWGGWWERLIGVVKQLLRSVLGSARVNLEELQTILCDVESVVNGRPLTYVSENGQDLKGLTPDEFIRNSTVTILPEADLTEKEKLGIRFKNIQAIREELRQRFLKEYLALLIHCGQGKKFREVKVGDVVLVGSDNQKRLDWPMGIVKEVKPGRDGGVRYARVQTNKGEYNRPVQRLYFLEINELD